MINLAFVLAQAEVIRAVKVYGIEGTEEKIKEIYKHMPKCKEVMLEAWKSIYGELLSI